MAQRKLSRHCRLFQWVREKDEKFSQAVTELCLEGIFTPRRGLTGAAFVLPGPKERKSVYDNTFTEKGNHAEAVATVKAHLLPLRLDDAASFAEGRAGSLLGARFLRAEAGKKAGELVVFYAGAGGKEQSFTIAKAADFRPVEDRENLSAWELKDGQPPRAASEPPYAPPRENRRRGKKTGAGVKGGAESGPAPRAHLAELVEREFEKEGSSRGGAFLRATTALLGCVRRHSPGLHQALLPLLDRNPFVCFYLLVEPFKHARAEEYLVPDEIVLKQWAGSTVVEGEDLQAEFESHFAAIAEPANRAFGYTQGAYLNAVLQRRGRILEQNGDAVNIFGAIAAAYRDLEKNNALGGVRNVFPPRTCALLKGGRKQWQDDMRCYLHHCSVGLVQEAAFDAGAFQDLTAAARRYAGDDFRGELRVTQAGRDVDRRGRRDAAVAFLNSDSFCYAASAKPRPHLSLEMTGQDQSGTVLGSGEPRNVEEMYNVLDKAKKQMVEVMSDHVKRFHSNAGTVARRSAVEVAAAARRKGIPLPDDFVDSISAE